jgi:alkylation response protein AidB-like acyl-CoA dehydrogenase
MERTLYLQEHLEFRESVRGFVARYVVPNLERYRRERLIERDLWLEAGRQGLLGIEVPEQFGGTGIRDPRFVAIVCEELARARLALASCIGIQIDVVAPYLLELGTPEQHERWLPGFCSGELVTALAMTEPDCGSDLAAIRTSARRDGGRWILNGSKTFITNGTSADLVLVVARTGPGRTMTVFAVESSLPGFSVGRKLEKVGQHEADTAELSFNDVELTDDEVLGEAGFGWRYMLDRLPRERLHAAYVNLAHAEATFQLTLDYAKSRRAFGRSIGSFQNSRFQLAEASIELDLARAFVDRCILEQVDGQLTPTAAAKAKYATSEIQNRVTDLGVQLHGGYGYTEEYEVGRAWADARVTRIYAGTNEIMKEIVGRSLGLGEPQAARPEPASAHSAPAEDQVVLSLGSGD